VATPNEERADTVDQRRRVGCEVEHFAADRDIELAELDLYRVTDDEASALVGTWLCRVVGPGGGGGVVVAAEHHDAERSECDRYGGRDGVDRRPAVAARPACRAAGTGSLGHRAAPGGGYDAR
jgi:hypothetical protein